MCIYVLWCSQRIARVNVYACVSLCVRVCMRVYVYVRAFARVCVRVHAEESPSNAVATRSRWSIIVPDPALFS